MLTKHKRRQVGPVVAAVGDTGVGSGAAVGRGDSETLRLGDSEKKSLSKGPGVVRDCLDEMGSRVYYAVQFCRWVKNAQDCLDAAYGEDRPVAKRLRELARCYGQSARGYYAVMMGKEGAAV